MTASAMPPLRVVRAWPGPFPQSFPSGLCFLDGLFPSRCSCALLQHTKQRRSTAFRRRTLALFQSRRTMRTNDMWKTSIAALALIAPLLALPAHAAELTVFATGSMAEPLKELGEEFTHATGHTLRFSIGTTSGVLNKLKAGEKGDVIVISDEAAEVLEKDGKLVPGTLKPVASSLFGVVVKAGTAMPDISTAERLNKAVTAARNISYPDPVLAAASGGYIESVFQQMGIKEDAKKKA